MLLHLRKKGCRSVSAASITSRACLCRVALFGGLCALNAALSEAGVLLHVNRPRCMVLHCSAWGRTPLQLLAPSQLPPSPRLAPRVALFSPLRNHPAAREVDARPVHMQKHTSFCQCRVGVEGARAIGQPHGLLGVLGQAEALHHVANHFTHACVGCDVERHRRRARSSQRHLERKKRGRKGAGNGPQRSPCTARTLPRGSALKYTRAEHL